MGAHRSYLNAVGMNRRAGFQRRRPPHRSRHFRKGRPAGAHSGTTANGSRVGVPAGTVHKVPGAELTDLEPPDGNLHRFRWDQALGFAQWLLKDEYPDEVTVYLVEGESFDPGAPLTPAVEAAVTRIADAIADDLAAVG